MKIVVLGLGRQGFRILELLCDRGIGPVDIFDICPETMKRAEERFKHQVRCLTKDPLSLKVGPREEFLSGYSLVLDALPSFISYNLMLSVIRAGARMVSVSFLEEDFMSLDAEAAKNGALVIPDCGGAPGFSHMMAGYSVNTLGSADRVVMKVGAIPAQPEPPFHHSLTWSVDDLMEEYFRPAKCRHNGRIIAPDPFDGIEEENIQGLPLQSFLSDGARSFLGSYPDVPFMEERTLRHHGHMEFMKPFRDAGFLTREPLDVGGCVIKPYLFLAAMLEKTFSNLPPEDRFIMNVEISGPGGRHQHRYNMPYRKDSGVFGLVNSVAVTAAETAAMVLDGTIKNEGVFPLELLSDKDKFERMAQAHRDQGAMVLLES